MSKNEHLNQRLNQKTAETKPKTPEETYIENQRKTDKYKQVRMVTAGMLPLPKANLVSPFCGKNEINLQNSQVTRIPKRQKQNELKLIFAVTASCNSSKGGNVTLL